VSINARQNNIGLKLFCVATIDMSVCVDYQKTGKIHHFQQKRKNQEKFCKSKSLLIKAAENNVSKQFFNFFREISDQYKKLPYTWYIYQV